MFPLFNIYAWMSDKDRELISKDIQEISCRDGIGASTMLQEMNKVYLHHMSRISCGKTAKPWEKLGPIWVCKVYEYNYVLATVVPVTEPLLHWEWSTNLGASGSCDTPEEAIAAASDVIKSFGYYIYKVVL